MKEYFLAACAVVLTACNHAQAPQEREVRQNDTVELTLEGPDMMPEDTFPEPVSVRKSVRYTPKQLKTLMDTLNRKIQKSEPGVRRLHGNVYAFSIRDSQIVVQMCLNTQQARAMFRKHISDSPAIRFEGPSEPKRDDRFFPSDTLGVALRPKQSTHAVTDTFATFVLRNNSGKAIEFGDGYGITFEDECGIWRILPSNPICNSIAYEIEPGRTHEIKAHLNPYLLPNKPGRYRFFFSFSFAGSQKEHTLMSEFRLE